MYQYYQFLIYIKEVSPTVHIYTYVAKTLQSDAQWEAMQIADVLCITSTGMHEVLHLCAMHSNDHTYTLFILIWFQKHPNGIACMYIVLVKREM